MVGTAVVFEEINSSLGLAYRYAWRTSDAFGFVKTTWLHNIGERSCRVELVDGIQNILPANVTTATQNVFSSLLDAYKRNELDPGTGLAIFALNSTLTDLAEPSESLLATTVVQLGLDKADYLLSSRQLDRFRTGKGVVQETEVRGQRGAYFVHTSLTFAPGEERTWHILADVNQDSGAIVQFVEKLKENRSDLVDALVRDIALNTSNLEKIVSAADGLQVSGDQLCCAHHFANVMFNVMRGGTFTEGYQVHKQDFIEFIAVRNRAILDEYVAFLFRNPIRIACSGPASPGGGKWFRGFNSFELCLSPIVVQPQAW